MRSSTEQAIEFANDNLSDVLDYFGNHLAGEMLLTALTMERFPDADDKQVVDAINELFDQKNL
jgi:hypothetical protein